MGITQPEIHKIELAPTSALRRPFLQVGLPSGVLSWYIGTMAEGETVLVERVQTGVRMEKRLLKVLKAFAEYHDLTLGDLLEGIVLHAFDGKTPFNPGSLNQIKELKKFYGLELDATASHRLKESRRPKSSYKRDVKVRRS
jgi:hypothetical protein